MDDPQLPSKLFGTKGCHFAATNPGSPGRHFLGSLNFRGLLLKVDLGVCPILLFDIGIKNVDAHQTDGVRGEKKTSSHVKIYKSQFSSAVTTRHDL